jgi:predicted nuclease of predicted toxin-antitoxin system
VNLLFDDSLSPKLIDLLGELFPGSESALRNGLARHGDVSILEYAIARDFVLVTTDSDFESLATRYVGACVVADATIRL